jgi:hypothetical protein
MDLRRWFGVLARVGLSVVGAGVFYVLFLAAFLKGHETGNSALIVALWLSAPVVTAAGFAAGGALLEPRGATGKAGFFQLLAWPLSACVVGAAIVYPFGPMLIVFGMFGAGTAGMVLRELFLVGKRDSGS